MQVFAFNLDEIPYEFGALAGLSFAKLVSLYYLYKYGVKPWIWVGKVSQLYLYPVKSCKGISVEEVIVSKDGGQFGAVKDRHWMIIDGEHQRATLRTLEKLALVTQSFDSDKLLLDAPGMDTLQLDTKPKFDKDQIIEIKLTGKQVPVLYAGDEAAKWINEFLGTTDLKIVHLPPQLEGIGMTHYNKPNSYYARPDDVKGLHDTAPFNFLPQSSVDDLQSRIPDENISVDRFRPNVVVTECEPYDEDTWKEVQIGDSYFTRTAMCTRCKVTTVDPADPKQAGRELEPLKTLRTYRLTPDIYKSPLLAAHFCPDNPGGSIRVGDDVYAVKEHFSDKD